MIMFTRYVLLLTSLLSSVSALPLALRDVVSPPITSPTASSVWMVGQTVTVTWSTIGLPVNQTNPVGMLILGYKANNSENLMLNSPLATNLNYSVGQAQVTVPDVPSGTDYIVVLFGDSGNASPEFTIINDSIAAVSTSVPPIPLPSSSAGSSSPAASTPASTPPANSNSPSSSGGSPPTPITGSPLPSGVLPTTTAPSGQTTASSSSTLVTVTSSTIPSPTQSSAAWQKQAPSLRIPLGVTLACIYFAFS